MTGVEMEACAWRWLLGLPRFDWQGVKNWQGVHGERQCSITLHPGTLHSNQGAPMVVVHVSHPAKPDVRFRGSGNSLSGAVNRVRQELWRAGIETPFPQAGP